MANVLERLTEGTVFQDKKKESAALVTKWENSGLLEGIQDDYQRGTLAVLLENQAKELLREANTMSSGDVQGFAAVAFPIVRRVFAGLIANDLVSVQPMSLPSGLVFFMDFKYGNQLGPAGDAVISAGDSLYGDRLGVEITGGVRVDGNAHAEKGFFSLSSGYGTARASADVLASRFTLFLAPLPCNELTASDSAAKVRFDPDLAAEASTKRVSVYRAPLATLQSDDALFKLVAEQDLTSLTMISGTAGDFSSTSPNTQTVTAATSPANGDLSASPSGVSGSLVRRLTRIVQGAGTNGTTDADGTKYLEVVFLHSADPSGSLTVNSSTLATSLGTGTTVVLGFPIKDQISAVGDSALGALKGASPFVLENSGSLPEIQLMVDSFSITARSRKLKASWTPELGQDLNAYHNLDAEVELTSILSEQIGLEIDQEILNDLIKGQTAGVKYWSRRPGKFVNRNTGVDLAGSAAGLGGPTYPPDFTGNVSMWYETLI